jgi:protein-disulfide isomerase
VDANTGPDGRPVAPEADPGREADADRADADRADADQADADRDPARPEPADPDPVLPEPPPVQTSPIRDRLAAAALGIGGVVLVVVVAWWSVAGRAADAAPESTAEPMFALVGSSVGFAAAPLTIEIWADFQCPYCGLFAHGVEPSLVREYAATGQALVVFRDFAFLGQESTEAAVAARCAGRDGKYWRYHDLLFATQQGENQGAFSREKLLGLARYSGVAVAAFTTCLDDPAVAAAVAAETAEGRQLGVSSTPSVRIVGPAGSELLAGLTDPTTIAAAVARQATPDASGGPDPSAATAGPGTSP